MNLKQFQYVLVLAKEGTFSKAAESLSIKQPSLSQYIRKIEQDVGMELFDRTGGYVRLTDAGQAYIEIGRKILDLEHQLEGKISDLSLCKTGTITIGIAAHRSVAFMPEIVRVFREKYPGIILKIIEKKRGEILDAAEHGEFDLCLTTLPVDEQLFQYETVFTEENVIAVPAGIKLDSYKMDLRKFPTVSVKNFHGMPFAMLNDEHPMQRELEVLCNDYGIFLQKTVECTSLEALLEMVKVGVGAAFIPSCIAKFSSGITYYSIREETTHREIVLMQRKEQSLSRAMVDLKNIIIETLQNIV